MLFRSPDPGAVRASAGEPQPIGQQAQPQQRQQQYEIYRRDTGDAVVFFLAPDDDTAIARMEQYRQTHRDRDYSVRVSRVQPHGI